MTNDQQSTQIMQNTRDIAALRESLKSAHKRIDDTDRTTNGIHEIAISVKTLAVQMTAMAESIARIEGGQKKQGERLGKLESEPGDKWKSLVTQILGLVVAAVMGVIISKFI